MTDDLVKQYRELQEVIGGCHDGYCVIRKPKGMHTNGGCRCLDNLSLPERSRVGHLLRCAQGMADRIEELEADNARLRLALNKSTDVRKWFYYPIEMPVTEDGKGPATVGEDAAHIYYEVWDVLLNTHATFGNLPDAINEAMRLNATLAELKGQDDE